MQAPTTDDPAFPPPPPRRHSNEHTGEHTREAEALPCTHPLSAARLETLALAHGQDRLERALGRFATCLEEDGDALLRAVALDAVTEIRRCAMLLEGPAMEMGGRPLARLCKDLKEDPTSAAARAGIWRLPAVLGETLWAVRAVAKGALRSGQAAEAALDRS